jgi:hypothetical protein
MAEDNPDDETHRKRPASDDESLTPPNPKRLNRNQGTADSFVTRCLDLFRQREQERRGLFEEWRSWYSYRSNH